MTGHQRKTKAKRYKWNAFICHASEDKQSVVGPLYHELVKYGLNIWFDKFSIKVGDSLRQTIDKGLANSRYGIVVFSPSFFLKHVAQAELDGLFSRDTEGRKVILPVWHEVDEAFLREKAATLVGKWAAKTTFGISELARQLVEIIKPSALTLDKSRARAESATEHLVQQLSKQNDALTFRVLTGPNVSIHSPRATDAVASFFDGRMRIDLIPKNMDAYKKNPLELSLSVTGEGLSKMQDLLRTGRAQDFSGAEIAKANMNFDLGLGVIDWSKSKISLGPPASAKKVPVRVVFGKNSHAVILPYLELCMERAGTDEIVLTATTTDGALIFRTVNPHPSLAKVNNAEVHLKLVGQEIHTIQRYYRALMALRDDGHFAIVELQTERTVLEGAIDGSVQMQPGGARIVDDLVSVADCLGLNLRWPKNVSEQDLQLLGQLKTLVDNKPANSGGPFTFEWLKSDNDSLNRFDSMKSGGRVALVQDRPVEFFGAVIESGTLALYSDAIVVDNFDATRELLAAAAVGGVVPMIANATSPFFLRLWRNTAKIATETPQGS